jgi:ClpP class serine protease
MPAISDTSRAVRAAIAEPWAITAEGLELVLAVASRETDVSIEALEAYRAQHVPTAERMTRRGPVAILDVRGPLFRHANLFTAISGATSYDVLARDLQAALDDPGVSAIVMNFDTPGGVVTGVNELGKAIRAGKAKKPITAYVGGAAASAGYWLAAQATSIVLDETGIVGSIGVRAVIVDTSKRDADAGRHEFVSSQSPGKRTDLGSDEGRGRVQRHVDALADVFIAAVADGRGVKPEDVVARFGGGDVLVGAAAVAAGMADRIGTFEAVVAELAKGIGPSRLKREGNLSMNTSIPRAEHEAAVAAARIEERQRIASILALDEANGREASAQHLALTTDMNADAVKGVLAGLPKATPTSPPVMGLRSHEAPGGLVTSDPVKTASAAEKRSGMWGNVVGKMNAEVDRHAGAVSGNRLMQGA